MKMMNFSTNPIKNSYNVVEQEKVEKGDKIPQEKKNNSLGISYVIVDEGILITRVKKWKLAYKLGLRKGDVIKKINGMFLEEFCPDLAYPVFYYCNYGTLTILDRCP